MEKLPEALRAELEPLARARANMMVLADPPKHTRLRALVSKAFTPRSVENMRSRIQDITDCLLDVLAPAGRMDFVRDFAFPLPAMVIAEMLGVPLHDRAKIKEWCDDITVAVTGRATPAVVSRAQESQIALTDYLRQVVADHRREPRDDLLSALITAEEQGRQLSEDELLANCVLMLSAGHETTTNFLANSVLALLQHPAEMERLRGDPSLIGTAAEELLRFDSPLQMTWRLTAEAIDVGGRWIEKGQVVRCWIGAANRDPAQFAEPDRLDVARPDNRHLAFSAGGHFCVGAALARLEGQVALTTLLRRFPVLALETDTLEWHDVIAARALTALPVVFADDAAVNP
jgi:cytochrome P450